MGSIAWKFFKTSQYDATYAVCSYCDKLIKKGSTTKTYNTSHLLKHLNRSHQKQFIEAQKSLSSGKKATSSSPNPKIRKKAAMSQASTKSYRTIKHWSFNDS